LFGRKGSNCADRRKQHASSQTVVDSEERWALSTLMTIRPPKPDKIADDCELLHALLTLDLKPKLQTIEHNQRRHS
jgi:hypothetical protein